MTHTLQDDFPLLVETMKRAAAALRDAEVPALLGGGLAAWARGGPPTEHDVDFFVRPEDAERALAALAAAGMRPERPPEGWLLKAWDGDVLVDLIFQPAGGPVDDGHFERAERLEVMAQPLLVASLDDVLTTKLLALTEQDLDFGPVLELARALREQIDWPLSARGRTAPRSRPPSSRWWKSSGSWRRRRVLRWFGASARAPPRRSRRAAAPARASSARRGGGRSRSSTRRASDPRAAAAAASFRAGRRARAS